MTKGKWAFMILSALLLLWIFTLPETPKESISQAAAESNREQAAANSQRIANEISQYLSSSFGMPGYETSWYPNIKQIFVEQQTVVARTDLSAADTRAQGICFAVSGFVWDNTNRHLGLTNVRVIGIGNTTLIERIGFSDRCQ
jgi:hypothetical protein